jgi:hypothetical protein
MDATKDRGESKVKEDKQPEKKTKCCRRIKKYI